MIIEPVNKSNIAQAAYVHRESWKESHSFLPADVVAKRTVERQTAYLYSEINSGKKVFLLTDKEPVGVVAVNGNMIDNLYVLPAMQRKGYGSALLDFAIRQCDGTPVLTVLNNNSAIEMYRKRGFKETGNIIPLGSRLWEIEMKLEK